MSGLTANFVDQVDYWSPGSWFINDMRCSEGDARQRWDNADADWTQPAYERMARLVMLQTERGVL